MWELSDEDIIDPGVAVGFIILPVPNVVLELGVQAANRNIPAIIIGKNQSGLFKSFLLGNYECDSFPKGRRIGMRRKAHNYL
jgi:hypothetical protein